MNNSVLVLGPPCVVCGKPVQLETTKTDENGQAVHGNCYTRVLVAARNDPPTPQHSEEDDLPHRRIIGKRKN